MTFATIFPKKYPIIGMIHLPPLLGYENSPGLTKVIEKALSDLDALEKAGIDGIMVENEHDQPHKVTVGPETVAAMTVVTQEVMRHAKNAIIGVEILLNDAKASIAVAKACDASFMRTDYFVDRMARDEYGGEMIINPQEIIDYRKSIDAEDVLILADIQVKYARMLEPKKLSDSAMQAQQARADAIIVTGTATGEAPILTDIKEAKEGIQSDFPVLIGSGLTPQNASDIFAFADGAIVGTGIKTGPDVDIKKATELMDVVRELRDKKLQ